MKFFKSLAVILLMLTCVSKSETIEEKTIRYIEKSQERYSFNVVDTIQLGNLPTNGIGTLDNTLSKYKDYLIFGLCDSNCSNVDMFFMDEHNDVLAMDVADDAFPIIIVSLKQDVFHSIKLVMTECKVASCGYSIVILHKAKNEI